MAAIAIVGCTSCTDNDAFTSQTNMPGSTNVSSSGSFSGGTATGQTAVGDDDITSFDVALNTASLSETEAVPSDETSEHYDDFIENWTTDKKQITITYNGSSATAEGEVDGVTVSIDGADVTVTSTKKKVEYILKGSSTQGSFKIYSDNKFGITLNGLSLTSTKGSAINIQKGADGGKRCYLNIADGTENTLKDATTYTMVNDEDQKACIFSEGKILVSGKGTLTINAQGKSGIASDDYVYLHAGTNITINASKTDGIKTNDGIYIGGGVLNISCTGTAGKGLNTEGLLSISGGRTTILASGGAEYDSSSQDISSAACAKSDSIINISGGELLVKATGTAGKGIKADQSLNITGGTVKVITTGKTYTASNRDTSSPKGIRVGDKSSKTGEINISGGDVCVRCTGGEGSEGIESKNKITISGGNVQSYCYDDAINAASNITISGGNVFGYATNNDGIDSNGTLTITGGVILASGTTAPEEGLDCDQNTFTITGGTIVGIGGSSSSPTSSVSTQPSLLASVSTAQNALVSICNSNGECIFAFKAPRQYSGATLLLSSPDMTKGSSITLCSGGTITGGNSFHGLITGGTISSASTVSTVTLSSMVNGSTSSSMGGGGAMGGGGMGGGFGW